MPAFLRMLIARIKGLVRRDAVAGEIQEELAFHVEMRVEEYERGGKSSDEARAMARARVGNVALHQDRGYDIRGGGVLETVVQDVRYALRLWKRQRGFAIAAVGTLALGIGLSTALFSVIDAALLRPLPYSQPEQLVQVTIADRTPDGDARSTGPSLNDARRWRADSRTISAVGIIRPYPMPTIIDAGRGPERLMVSEIGEGVLDVYAVAPVLGRAVTVDDFATGAPRVAMLGYSYWQTNFGGAVDVLGRTVRFTSGEPATIIGVLPHGFYRRTDLWTPHVSLRPGDFAEQRGLGTDAYARLRPGVTREAASSDLTAISTRDASARDMPAGVRVDLRSLRADLVSGFGPTIRILSAAVAFVLLIACVNVAGLLMARGRTRRTEMALRISIGASRGRLIRQLITESTVLALFGGVAGVALASVTLDTLVAAIPLGLPLTSSVSLNFTALAFALTLSLITAIAFGLLPSISLSRTGVLIIGDSLRLRRSPMSRRGGQWLIGTEVAVAVLLLIVAGLLVRSLNRAMNVDIGFDANAVLVMKVEPINQSVEALTQFYPALLDRLRAHRDVAAAGAVDTLPLDPVGLFGFANVSGQAPQDVRLRHALPGYFDAMGLTITHGRAPTLHDFDGSRAVVLNTTAANRLFPGSSAIGKSIMLGFGTNHREVIGVTNDVRQDGPLGDAAPDVTELSGSRITEPMIVVIRPKRGARLNTSDLRDIAQHVGPPVFVDDIVPAARLLSDTVATSRHRTLLFGLLGALGCGLTLVGIFGVTAYAVSSRTQEIGVRMAFGATPQQMVSTVMTDAAWPLMIGTAVGLVGAQLSTGVIAAFLFQTTPTDPVTFVAVAFVFPMAAGAAAWLSARRAAHVDPMSALRIE